MEPTPGGSARCNSAVPRGTSSCHPPLFRCESAAPANMPPGWAAAPPPASGQGVPTGGSAPEDGLLSCGRALASASRLSRHRSSPLSDTWGGPRRRAEPIGPLPASADLRTLPSGRTSEQWLLGRDAVSPGEPLGARIHLAQNAVFEFLMNDFSRLQPELAQWLRRPPLSVRGPTLRAWGLRHQEPCVHLQERERRTRPARPGARRIGPAPRRTWPSGPGRARLPRHAPRAP